MSYTDTLNNIKADIDVFYKTVGNLKLPMQVFLPDDFDETNKYKTVIAIHGGGWHSFTETPVDWDGGWMANDVKFYAEKGYVGIVFTYREINLDESTDVGNLLEDCRDAMKYIVNNFSFVDEDNVLLMGDSAGGHLALCLGMSLPNGEKSALKLNKIATYNPITECVNSRWKFCAEDAIKYSPVNNIKPVDFKLLVMHGTADTLVDIEDSRVFADKMKSVGNDVTMIEVPDARHSFILFGYTAEDKDIINVLEFTNKHFDME